MTEKTDTEQATDRNGLESKWHEELPLLALLAASFLGIVFCIKYLLNPAAFDPSQLGQFGDYVGGILNPLISAFTLTVAVSVWKLQREALRIQKAELTQTREAIKQQTFDQFFMSMLASHRAMTEQVTLIDGETANTLQTGKRAIDSYRGFLNRFISDIKSLQYEPAPNDKSMRLGQEAALSLIKVAISQHSSFWKMPHDLTIPYFSYFMVRYYKKDLKLIDGKVLESQSELSYEQVFGHIFRSTYQILKIIDEQFGDDVISKKRYVNLLRAQMSESEFIFFALSALTEDGKKSWARSIQLNFFEDRLQNLPWTQKLAESFVTDEPSRQQATKILREE